MLLPLYFYPMKKSIHVTFFFRKPDDFHFSIEKVFQGIIDHLPEHIKVKKAISPYPSQGLKPRLKNLTAVRKQQSQVNHITGDVHYLALGLPRKNTILTIHDLGMMNHPNPLARLILWFFWIWWPVRRVKMVTTISEATKKDILKYARCSPEKARVVPDFLDPNYTFKAKNFNQNQPVILQIGTKFNKNIERTLKAIQGVPCMLWIVGKLTENHMNLLEELKISYKNFYRISNEALKDLYEQCDLLTFCSTLEGFGLPILEAQAIGRPVVTSKISSMPEVGGEGGCCYVDPYDTVSIRKGILKVIEEKEFREQLIQNGLENVKRFHVYAIAGQYVALYEEILS